MSEMATKSERRAMQFIKDHPGGRRDKAFPFGEVFRFDAPELKRAPFRVATIRRLIDRGLVSASGIVRLTPKGERVLATLKETETTPQENE
jgi:hypothetical protein